jgi:hypothetical protein
MPLHDYLFIDRIGQQDLGKQIPQERKPAKQRQVD